ncbi:MAG: hypothetical protein QW057_09620 [Candidatus Bathyarchaeia archaeon]
MSSHSFLSVSASPEVFEYYGYTPPSNFSALDADPRAFPYFRLGWEVDPVTGAYKQNYGYVDNGTCYLDIIGINDSTKVWVYDITGTEPLLRESFTVNRMELHNTTIPAKTYFKVVSDKRVAVAMGGGGSYLGEVHTPYPSTDGGFAGKEFIFMAFPGSFDGYFGVGNMIYAIDSTKVTLYDDKSQVVTQKELKANETLPNLKISSRKVYRIELTGRAAVAAWGFASFTNARPLMGGYVGQYFLVNPRASSWSTMEIPALIVVNQGAASRVTVKEIGKTALATKEMAPNSVWFLDQTNVDIYSKNLVVESTGDIMVFVSTTWGSTPGIGKLYQGVAFIGVKPNQPTTLHTFSKAIAFSPEANAHVTIENLELEIRKGGYAELPGGLITLASNVTLVVELISLPVTYLATGGLGVGDEVAYEVPALSNWGVYLIPTESARITYPPPVVETGMDITLIAAAAAAVVIVAAAVVWKKPWKRGPG